MMRCCRIRLPLLIEQADLEYKMGVMISWVLGDERLASHLSRGTDA